MDLQWPITGLVDQMRIKFILIVKKIIYVLFYKNLFRSLEMKFIVLGKYSSQGLSGFIKNPSDDRKEAISAMMEKAGAKLLDLYLLRGEYDIAAIGEAESFEDVAAVKLLVASSGAVENISILEMLDMNSIAKKAAAISDAYRAPGSQ